MCVCVLSVLKSIREEIKALRREEGSFVVSCKERQSVLQLWTECQWAVGLFYCIHMFLDVLHHQIEKRMTDWTVFVPLSVLLSPQRAFVHLQKLRQSAQFC